MGKRHVDVQLRPFTADDIPHKMAWVHDPKVNRFLHFELPLTEVQILDWLDRRDAEHRHDLVIETFEGRPIGTLGIENLSWQHRRGEAYICIGEPEFWGTNVGQQATGQLLDYAFLQLGLNRLFIMTENLAAVGHYLKAGLRIEGTLQHFYIRDGAPRDGLIMGMVAQDYFDVRAGDVPQGGSQSLELARYVEVIRAYSFPATASPADRTAAVGGSRENWQDLSEQPQMRPILDRLEHARRSSRLGRCGEVSIRPRGHGAWEPLLSALLAAVLGPGEGAGAFQSLENLWRQAEQADASEPLTPALWHAVYRALRLAVVQVSVPAGVV